MFRQRATTMFGSLFAAPPRKKFFLLLLVEFRFFCQLFDILR